jgi:RNA polymerase sigma-70 factor (ECF subfamily)
VVSDDDAAWLRQAAQGDTAAFDRIMTMHGAAVQRFLNTIGTRDVEDAVQETFIAAWRSASHYAGAGSVRSWLLSIARNVQRHQLRRRVDEPTSFESLDVLAAQAGWGCDPAEARRVEIALARDVLAQAMATLPEDEREVLLLREIEGLSGDETAAMLHVTLPAMKSRLHRARIHLAAAVRRTDAPETTRRDHGGA